MSRRFIVLGLAAALAGVLIVSASGGSATPKQPRVLRFLAVSMPDQFIPIDGFSENAPPELGARFIFRAAVLNDGRRFDQPSRARVGRLDGLCTVTSQEAGDSLCTITAHIPGGYILASGDIRVTRDVDVFALVGGTGAYGNARGTLKVTDLGSSETGVQTSALLVRLIP